MPDSNRPGSRWMPVAVIGAALVLAHLAFSPLGFNPTDDGFILAASRRVLDGQFPHRDFISIRPVGSALLHLPEVLWGGPYTFWISRLVVWLEFTLVAWCWVRLAERARGGPFPAAGRVALFVIALALTSHTFPLMAWHTIDGLFLATLGLWLVGSAHRARLVGYALIGAGMLCKQNFGLLGPAAIVLMSDAKRITAWIAWMTPAVLYAAVLAAGGALADAAGQLTTQSDLVRGGILPYATNLLFHGGTVLGFLLTVIGRGRRTGARTRRSWIAQTALALLVLIAGATMNRNDFFYLDHASFLLFGLALGVLVADLTLRGWPDAGVRFTGLALCVAWTASVSLGYRTPALAAGPLAVAALGALVEPRPAGAGRPSSRIWAPVVALAGLLGIVWVAARLNHVYHELPASELTYPLDDVLPGGRFLRTSHNTFAVLSDLQQAVAKVEGRPYAIVTDFAGWWAQSRANNPLSIDWPQGLELNREPLQRRALRDLERLRGHGRIVVQKIYGMDVASRLIPLGNDNGYYFMVAYVRTNFHKTNETRWFEIYE